MRLSAVILTALALYVVVAAADDFDTLRDAVARGDYAVAVPGLEAAAAQDDPRALSLLATLYQLGQGVAQNASKAVELYARAAALGDAEAQFNLGNIYLLGEGVRADEAWALTYYRQAASQGHELAARNLKELYRASGLEPPPEPLVPSTQPTTEEVAHARAEPGVAPAPAVADDPLAPTMQVGREVATPAKTAATQGAPLTPAPVRTQSAP